MKRQAGILGKHVTDTPKSKMGQIVNASFHGATWSERLWVNHDELKGALDGVLSRAMIQGLNPKTIISSLLPLVANTVNNKRYVAERLAITETARIQDTAQMDSFKKYGFDYCVWVAEPSACDLCTDIANAHDGVYRITEVPGIPEHPMCRCSKSAYVPTKEELTKWGMAEVKADGTAVDIEIDEFTPCLRDMNSGKLVDTEYKPVSVSAAEARRLREAGWNFDWSNTKGQVIKLTLANDNASQGFVSLYDDQGFTFVDLVESAPYNIGKGKRYAGVGPHLFAIAAEASFKAGNEGFVSFTPKTLLHDHYRDTLGAQDLPGGNQYLDTKAALVLLRKYMKWK